MKTIGAVRKKLKGKQDKAKEIVIVNSALDVVRTECSKWKSMEKECSGSLIGKYVKNKCFILYAVRTGHFAHQSFGGVTTDSDYQNKVFDIILAEYPEAGLAYIGDYHLHPMYLPTLSGTDERTCCEILSDPRHEELPKLAILLITYSGDQEKICPYLVSRAGNGQISIAEANLHTVASEDICVKTMLKQEYADIDFLAKDLHKVTAFPDTRTGVEENLLGVLYDTPFYEVPAARKRFMEEIDRIGQVFGADAAPAYVEDGIVSLEFQTQGTTVHIFFPREYPLNPPTILFGFSDSKLFEFSSKRSWNSMSSSVELLEELFEEKGGKYCE